MLFYPTPAKPSVLCLDVIEAEAQVGVYAVALACEETVIVPDILLAIDGAADSGVLDAGISVFQEVLGLLALYHKNLALVAEYGIVDVHSSAAAETHALCVRTIAHEDKVCQRGI